MADSDFNWVGPVMGTMLVGGLLVGMSNALFGSQQRQQQQAPAPTKRKRKKADVYSRDGRLSKEDLWASAGYRPFNTPW